MLWNEDDRITIFDKDSFNQQYRFTGEDGDNAGGFRIVPSEDEFTTGNELDKIYAIYPYKESNAISNRGVFSCYIPSEQAFHENSFGIGANTMVAASSDNKLRFKNVGGYLSFKFFGEGMSISSIALKGNNGELLAGKCSIDISSGLPVLTMDEGNVSETVTLTCDPAVDLGNSSSEAIAFWFVLPPVTFTKGITVTVTTSDGGVFEKSTSSKFEIGRSAITKFGALEVVPTYAVPEVVDLGLSVMWASFNLGATSPEQSGDYYAWGEVTPKESYNWSTYKWCNGTSSSMTKYCLNSSYGEVDGLSLLEKEDDAATVNLGDGWRLPTNSEWAELRQNCYISWTTINGVYGYKFTSRIQGFTDKFIFIPAAGLYDDSTHKDLSAGSYWSGSLGGSNTPYNVDFDAGGFYLDNNSTHSRQRGLSIRPVWEGSVTPPAVINVESITLNKESLKLTVEGSATLIPTIEPDDATNKNVTWASSDESVATVDSEGTVTGVSAGTAVITVTTEDGGLTASCSVIVKSFPESTVFDEDAFITYVANHQEWLNISADNTYIYDTYFSAGVSGTRFEMKFHMPEDYSLRPLLYSGSGGSITIDASNIYYRYSERHHEDGDTWYTIEYAEGVESGIEGKGIVVMSVSCDGDHFSANVNGKETTIPQSVSSMSFQYLFSSYSYEHDDGSLYEYRAGIPEGAKLYYVKIWNGDDLVYFGHASRAVCSYSSEEEYCWYEEIGNKFTFARNLHTLTSSEVKPYNPSSPIATVRQAFGGGID